MLSYLEKSGATNSTEALRQDVTSGFNEADFTGD